jgi:hypothetical protein
MYTRTMKIHSLLIALLLVCTIITKGQSNIEKARIYFKEAQTLSEKDGGKLWGFDLYGPLVFVDDETREAVANYPVPVDNWKEYDGLYAGTLPDKIGLANTAFDWNGESWSMVIFSSMSDDIYDRGSLMMHELWHQHENKLELFINSETSNHLDTKAGRLLLFLEWNALIDACNKEGKQRSGSVEDALTFRKIRAELFPEEFASETANELHEGLAEYTGMALSGRDKQKKIEYLQNRVVSHYNDNTISWTHAYTSGALYGFLLDEQSPGWNMELCKGSDLGQVTFLEYGLDYSSIEEKDYAKTGSQYGYDSLERIEENRVATTKALNESFVRRFENEPTLFMPNYSLSIQFSPSKITPFESKGNIYGELSAQSRWGEIVVGHGGILLLKGWKGLVLDVGENWNPVDSLVTDRYEIKLADGYEITETENGWTIIKSSN